MHLANVEYMGQLVGARTALTRSLAATVVHHSLSRLHGSVPRPHIGMGPDPSGAEKLPRNPNGYF